MGLTLARQGLDIRRSFKGRLSKRRYTMSFKDLIDSCEAASPYHMPPRSEIEAMPERDRLTEMVISRPVPPALYFAFQRGGTFNQ